MEAQKYAVVKQQIIKNYCYSYYSKKIKYCTDISMIFIK